MTNLYSQLRADQGARQGGVNIANDQHPVGFFTQHYRFKSLHLRDGLYGVSCGTNLQIDVGLWQVQIA